MGLSSRTLDQYLGEFDVSWRKVGSKTHEPEGVSVVAARLKGGIGGELGSYHFRWGKHYRE